MLDVSRQPPLHEIKPRVDAAHQRLGGTELKFEFGVRVVADESGSYFFTRYKFPSVRINRSEPMTA